MRVFVLFLSKVAWTLHPSPFRNALRFQETCEIMICSVIYPFSIRRNLSLGPYNTLLHGRLFGAKLRMTVALFNGNADISNQLKGDHRGPTPHTHMWCVPTKTIDCRQRNSLLQLLLQAVDDYRCQEFVSDLDTSICIVNSVPCWIKLLQKCQKLWSAENSYIYRLAVHVQLSPMKSWKVTWRWAAKFCQVPICDVRTTTAFKLYACTCTEVYCMGM